MGRWGVWTVVCIGVWGCAGGGGDGVSPAPAEVTWLSEGSGAASEAPLWTLAPARCSPLGGIVFPPVLFEGREVVPVDELRAVHQAGALARFFVEGDEGIYWAGTLRDGLFAQPLLLLPATLRDGMEWAVAGEEKAPDFRVVVERRQASESEPAGWSVAASYVDRFGAPRDLTLTLGESMADIALLDVNEDGDCIVPHSPLPSPAASERRRATLVPLRGGAPILENTLAERVSVVDDPHTAPGRLQVATRGWGLTWSLERGYDLYSDSWCHHMEGDSLTPGDPETSCPEAGGVIVTAERSETVPSVGDRGAPYLACTHSTGYGGVTVTECFSALSVIFARPDGILEAGEVTIYDELFFGPYLPDGDPWKVDRQVRALHPFLTWRGGRGGRYAMVHQRSDGGLTLGMPGVGLREEIAHYSAEREQVGFAPGALRSGLLSTWSGPEGRFAFQHTNWGRVERVEIAEDGLRVHHLADVELPEGHFVVGAFARDGKLGVLTQGGFVGFDAPVNYEAGERGVDLGDVYAWTTEVSAFAPASEPAGALAPLPTVFLDPRGDDLELCWPAPYGTPLLEGWLLDGAAPVAAIATADNCVLLLRDLEQGPSGERVWAEGELPGIGRVTFSTSDRAKLDVSAAGISSGILLEGSVAAIDRNHEDMQIAALRGGGFVNNLHWFSPGFVLTVPSEVNTPDWGLPDAWGHGLWTNREGTSEVVLLGEQNVRIPRPELEVLLSASPGAPPARPAGGGGILVGDKVLSPDGRLRTLPFVADGVLADGTACALGLFPSDPIAPEALRTLPYRCVDRAGREFSGHHQAIFSDWAWPTADGVFVLVREFRHGMPWSGDYGVFDPRTGLTVYHELPLPAAGGDGSHFGDGAGALAYDSEGHLYRFMGLKRVDALGGATGSYQSLQRLDAAGPVDLPLPGVDFIGNGNRFRLAVGSEVIAIAVVSGRTNEPFSRVLRFPRPDRVVPGDCEPSPEICNGEDDDCDGQTDEPPAADEACVLDNAVSACVDGRCELLDCLPGYASCDDREDTGCETEANTPARCGECERVCAPGMDCDEGECTEHVTALVAGDEHVCALARGGRVWCFGAAGTLGDGSQSSADSPVPVPLEGVVVLAAGRGHTCALDEDGAVWCWGDGSSGQCDPDYLDQAWTPRRVGDLPAAEALGAGRYFTCAVDAEGATRCWGATPGRGPGVHPIAEVAGLPAVQAVGGGLSHACVLAEDGAVWCWGEGHDGQLGQTLAETATPVLVPGVTGATGLFVGAYDAVVQSAAGPVVWGRVAGQTVGGGNAEPLLVPALAGLLDWDAREAFACLASPEGASCYGSANLEVFGPAQTTNAPAPLPVLAQPSSAVATAARAVCAATDEGDLFCWGAGLASGAGAAGAVLTPQRVPLQ